MIIMDKIREAVYYLKKYHRYENKNLLELLSLLNKITDETFSNILEKVLNSNITNHSQLDKLSDDLIYKILIDNSNNTTDSTIIQHSIERDEEAVVPGSNSIEDPILAKPLNPQTQAVVVKPPTPKPMPKVVKPNPAKPIVKPKQPVTKN